MSRPYLPEIIKACSDEKNPVIRQQAIAAVQQLTKEGIFVIYTCVSISLISHLESNRNLLVKHGVLKILIKALSLETAEVTQRYIVVALFRLVLNNGILQIHSQCLC